MAMNDRSGRRIALAAVSGAHGVKGEVRLKLFTSTLENFKHYDRLYVGGTPLKLIESRRSGSNVIVRFEGCSSRESAEALRGNLVEIDRLDLPPLKDGEYYHADLLGLRVLDQQGKAIGTVVAVENYGAGDLLEIETLASAEKAGRFLIPFREGIADWIDDAIVVDPAFLA